MKDTVQKYNKKILGYKLKIRDLQENLANVQNECELLREENEQLQHKYNADNWFKFKISKLKTEYESKIKEIIDEVKDNEQKTQEYVEDRCKQYSNYSELSNKKPCIDKHSLKRSPSNTQKSKVQTHREHQPSGFLSPRKPIQYYQTRNNKPDAIETLPLPPNTECLKFSKSPENLDKVSLLSHREKLNKYRYAFTFA